MNFVIEDTTCKKVSPLKWSCENGSLSPGCLFLPNPVNVRYAKQPSDRTNLTSLFPTQYKDEASLTPLPHFDGVFFKKKKDKELVKA